MADNSPDLDDSPFPTLTSPQPRANSPSPTVPAASDDDSDDTPLNYAHLTQTQPSSALPRRGIKDFESHGTNAQRSVLENSRGAMHEALSVGRVHAGKGGLVGWFDVGGEEMRGWGTGAGKDHSGEKDRGLGMGERRVVIEKPTGQHVRTTGQADREGRLWLLPEEVVYLVERGSLEVRYRVAQPSRNWGIEEEEGVEESDGRDFDGRQQEETKEAEEGEDKGWDGVSLSLQACYAHFIGRDGLTLERYIVYAGLRRSGYIVLRAPEWYGHPSPYSPHAPNKAQAQEKSLGIWHWLYNHLLSSSAAEPPALGPLVGRGLYRNYSQPSNPLFSLIFSKTQY
ncbi:MAG: hypothetical protein Q9202_006186 [Teloschistes flavicans]